MGAGFIVPYARNAAKNPRPASLTYVGNSGGGATTLLAADRSYVGGTSVVASLPTTQSARWDTGAASSLGGASGARTFTGKVRLSGDGASFNVTLRVEHTDATFVDSATVAVVTEATGRFVPSAAMTVVSTAGKQASRLAVIVTNPAGTTKVVYLGGFDVREGPSVDAYVDGSQGTGYAWEGTAHDSASTRAATTISPPAVRGSGGQLRYRVELYRVNRRNQILEDVTSAFVAGSVNYDLTSDRWKGTCRIEANRHGIINAWADEYLRPQIVIEDAAGLVRTMQLGLFLMDPPRDRHDATSRHRLSYDGRDLLAVLQDDTLQTPMYFDTPQRFITRMLEMLNDAGFGADLVSFPRTDDEDFEVEHFTSFGKGTPRLEVMNHLITGAAWHSPWVTLAGQITSRPMTKLVDETPAVTYATGPNSPVRWAFEAAPILGGQGNRVTVTGNKPKRGHVKVTVENNDPAHPFSIPRLGRVIDLPPVRDSHVHSAAAARRLADRILEEAGQMPLAARLVTTIDPDRQLNEAYLLDLKTSDGEPIQSGQGMYSCNGWSVSLGQPWLMQHQLRRVVPIEDATAVAPTWVPGGSILDIVVDSSGNPVVDSLGNQIVVG